IQHQNLKMELAPARHISGRSITARNPPLRRSRIIRGERDNLYFSGDGGYGPHFKEIGDRYGPFDFAMMECGQYDERWAQIHMMPEETAQAAVDVQAKLMMPIHWGAFRLALHSWTDPIERVTNHAKKLEQALIAPKIGEPVVLDASLPQYTTWWENDLRKAAR
ncbi:MAG: MBL fold metallo-hydrolase, partial [Cyclobacteriaceae bacterium]